MRCHIGRHTRIAIFFPLHLTALVAQNKSEPPPPAPTLTTQEYTEILNRLFPTSQDNGPDVVFALSLRVIPAFDPESQIDLVLHREQNSTVQYSRADRNVYYGGSKLLQTPGEHSIESLAQSVKVTRRSLNVNPKQILQWQRDLFTALALTQAKFPKKAADYFATGSTTLVMDGVMYELHYKQSMTTLDIKFMDEPVKRDLLKWATKLHEDVSKVTDSN